MLEGPRIDSLEPGREEAEGVGVGVSEGEGVWLSAPISDCPCQGCVLLRNSV